MLIIIGLVIIIGLAIVYVLFRIGRALFRTWKISVPMIFGVCLLGILLGILASTRIISMDDAGGFMGAVVLVAIGVLAWAADACCPHCKTPTIKKVGERHLSTSGVYQQKCNDGCYHPHQKITGENIYKCSKCGYEKRSQWTKAERLDT